MNRPGDPPDAVYAAVRDTDPDTLDAEQLDVLLHQIARIRAWCDARQVRATRRQRALADAGRAADPRDSLANHGRQSSRDARAASERESICSAMPGLEEALLAGAVSAGHVDAISGATRDLDPGERAEFVAESASLLGDATRQSVDTFGRSCRELARSIRSHTRARSDVDELEEQRRRSRITRWVDRESGMHSTLIECDPVTDRRIWTAIQRERGRLRRQCHGTGGAKPSWDRLTVDALAEAVAPPTANGQTARPTLVVHIDLGTLTDGRHDRTVCETDSGVPIPVETARHLACDADLVPVVLDGAGVVLDEGRSKRLATFEQRMALGAMQATCSHPDCRVSIDDCRVHHLRPWSRGGRTDLAELAPLCETHHHLVHEGGWSLTMTSDRIATWTRPDGHVHWTGPVGDRRPACRAT